MKSSKAILIKPLLKGIVVPSGRSRSQGRRLTKQKKDKNRQILCKSLFFICFSSLCLFFVRTKLCLTAIREIPSLEA